MASNVVNLNRFRKKKERKAKAKQAEVNRIRHGRTQAEKDRERAEREHAARSIEGKRVERDLVVGDIYGPHGGGAAHISYGSATGLPTAVSRTIAWSVPQAAFVAALPR
jgi:hypothetical protein